MDGSVHIAWLLSLVTLAKQNNPISESPKVARQINSQKYRQPADNRSMVVNIAATNESNPLMVVNHKSAIERSSLVSTLRSNQTDSQPKISPAS